MSTAAEQFLIWFLNTIRKRRQPKPRRRDVVLGVSSRRDAEHPFVILRETLRPQHLGIVGLSGSGKTYLIENMIRQDIEHHTGFVVFDVHGDLADNVVAYLAERGPFDPEIARRTVILEPFDPDRSFGFNPLQRVDGTDAFLQAKEFAYILRQHWQESFSPRMEELLINSLYTLCETNQTLLRLPDLLTDAQFRRTVVERLPAAQVRQYWTNRFDKLSSGMQATFREPILSRLALFLTDPLMRDIIGQEKSTFSFQDAMRQGQWIIVNLSKGRLGENSTILGSLLFTRLELDIMAMAKTKDQDRRLFAVYADELQNLVGKSFGRLVAEARKYRVSLVSGHQFWQQLDVSLRQAMLSVGSKVFFRLHYHDAVDLAGELSADERRRYTRLLTTLGRGEAIVRLASHYPILFSVRQYRKATPTDRELRTLKSASAARHTRQRTDIHTDIEAARTPSANLGLIQKDRGRQLLNP